MAANTATPLPTRENPARWLTAGDLVVGDVIVVRRGETARVTALRPVGKGRTQVVITGNRVMYPKATAGTPALVLR